MQRSLIAFLLMAVTAGTLCAQPPPLRIEGRRILDDRGREVLLKGISVSQSCKRPPYLPWQGEEDFDKLKKWGFNTIRLLIMWTALEPEPGKFDQAYLDKLDRYISMAADRGIYVILDMHQDMYSQKYRGNGAPAWACIDGGVPPQKPGAAPWYYGYTQEAVIRAFESFWRNAPAPDGKGVQDHFIETWCRVAARYARDTRIIGYDLFNEPFYGMDFGTILNLVVAAFVKIVPPEKYQLAVGIANPKNLRDILEYFHDNDAFYRTLDSLNGAICSFETTKLMPFYDRLISAMIRKDPRRIYFIEPHIMKGAGARSFLRRPRVPADISVCYAPHYYDPTIVWQFPYDGNIERSDIAFRTIREEADAMEVPVLLGEWGALSDRVVNASRHIADQMSLIEKHLLHNSYWQYSRSFEKHSFLDLIVRPYPQKTAGRLAAYGFDPRGKVFRLSYSNTDAKGDTIVFLPKDRHYKAGFVVRSSDPQGKWSWRWNEDESTLSIRHDPDSETHEIAITPVTQGTNDSRRPATTRSKKE